MKVEGNRGAWAAWSGAVCAGAAAVATLLAALFTGWAWHLITVILAVVSGVAFLLLVWTGFQPAGAWLRQRRPRRRHGPGAAVTDRWRFTTNGTLVPVLARMGLYGFDHPGYLRSGDSGPPSMRVMTMVACSPLGDQPESRELRARFLAMLAGAAFTDLISDLAGSPSGVTWRPRASSRPSNLKADLTSENPDAVPVASAALELPVTGLRLAGNDPRYAQLIVHMDLAAVQVIPGLPDWRRRLVRALSLAGELARFLTGIGLSTYGDPPAQLGVMLQAREAITEIVDPGQIKALPARYNVNETAGYLIADPNGETAADAAGRLLVDLSERVLHLDGSAEEMAGL